MAEVRGLSRQSKYQSSLDELESDLNLDFALGLSSDEVRELLPFLEDLEDGIQNIFVVIETIEALVEYFSTIIEFIASIIGIAVDIFEAVITLIREILNQVSELFSGTSINAMTHFPTDYKSRRTPDQILYDVGMSYLDKNDGNKPVANQNNYVAILVMMFSAPNLQKLMSLFSDLSKSFKGFADEDFSFDLNNNTDETGENTLRGSSGMSPDWDRSISLLDFGACKKIYDVLQSYISALSKGQTIVERLNAIINAVLRRIERIKLTVEEILKAIANLLALFSLGAGQNILVIKGKGANEDFAQAIIDAPNHKNYPRVDYSDPPTGQKVTTLDRDLGQKYLFSGAFCLHLQAGASDDNIKRIETLLNLFKKEASNTEKKLKSDSKLLQSSNAKVNKALSGSLETGWTQVPQ